MQFCYGRSRSSYSQEGEDMILQRIFERRESGFYIDIGAHHPKRFSNTHLLYKKGWNGINIDAMPGSMRCFNRVRKRDVNLELGIGEKEQDLTYYIFNDPALNGFSSDISKKRHNNKSQFSIIKKLPVQVKKLSTILNEHLSKNQIIDFMTIDVEGLDLEVLESNNWEKFKPEYILIEVLKLNFNEISNDKITLFLEEKGYQVFAKCVNTVFFKKKTT
jgi:FkbM family methyltransferase